MVSSTWLAQRGDLAGGIDDFERDHHLFTFDGFVVVGARQIRAELFAHRAFQDPWAIGSGEHSVVQEASGGQRCDMGFPRWEQWTTQLGPRRAEVILRFRCLPQRRVLADELLCKR